MILSEINGICSSHPEPDIWFPDGLVGRPSREKMQMVADSALEAIKLCNQCPAMLECRQEGMKDENLVHGIWGGLLAGQRLELLGKQREDFPLQSDKGRAMDLYIRLKPLLKE